MTLKSFLIMLHLFVKHQHFDYPMVCLLQKKCEHVIWLVVWNMTFMTFHSVAKFIIPTVIELDDGKIYRKTHQI